MLVVVLTFDGIILLLMVNIVSITTFDFLQSAATEVAVILICCFIIMKVMSLKRQRHVTLNDESDENEDALK